MRPVVVVDGSPVFDDGFRLEQRVERLDGEHLVADAASRRTRRTGSARASRARCSCVPAPPKRHQSRSALAVSSGPLSIRTSSGPAAALGGRSGRARGRCGRRRSRRATSDRQRLAGVLVDDVQQLQHPAVGGGVELEVERPDVIRAARPAAAPPASSSSPSRCRLRRLARHTQALLAPEPLDLLAVHLPSPPRAATPTPCR